MQFFTTAVVFSLLALSASALPTILDASEIEARANSTTIDPSLVPHFSIVAGSGKGANGVAIPTTCPPARDAFIAKLSANVAAGKVLDIPITFNTNPAVKDANTQKTRATAMIVTLQSFTGKKGVGCPAAATPELSTQQKTGVQSP
jgi:hypothetical protein